MAGLLQPEEWECPLRDGGTKTFILSRFPAIAGREIIAGYPLTGIPKIGEYKQNEVIMQKLMAYVAVPMPAPAEPLRLTTPALIDNHCPDWECLARLEVEMLKRNSSFFSNGRASTFLQGIAQQLQALTIKTLTGLSAQLSKAEKQPSKN